MNKALSLEDWLAHHRVTQTELARRLGVDPNTVHRWVRGHRQPGWGTVRRLVELTQGQVTADSFLSPQEHEGSAA